ncbi:MAG TPA: hypothetical protein VK173_09790, partial [Lacibacter sp.]|nr:hypothetical protein [Lacibacter sp.]
IPHEVSYSDRTVQASYDSLNFVSTWAMDSTINEGMPYLRSNPPLEYYDLLAPSGDSDPAKDAGYPPFNFFFIKNY